VVSSDSGDDMPWTLWSYVRKTTFRKPNRKRFAFVTTSVTIAARESLTVFVLTTA